MNSIDNRIVQMEFDNQEFERGVATSLKTLEQLKEGLDFSESEKSLSSLSTATKSFTLEHMTSSMSASMSQLVSWVAKLEVAQKAIQAIEGVISSVSRTINELSFGQISAGFNKYDQYSRSVKTIMSATGKSVEEVGKRMDKLMWYSDETSYSFTDMTSAIGKFTSNNVELDLAATAVMGISNAAALAGQNAAQATHAYEGFAKSIAQGKFTRNTWQWVKTAKMDTTKFKETALEAAVAVGTLTKKADGTYKTKKGTVVSTESFEPSITEGWFTKEAILKTLEAYGSFTDELYEMYKVADDGVTTSDILRQLGNDAENLGMQAFKAGQEARTFADAIEATKDATSTQWLKVFELIIGNAEEATVVWTDLANGLWDVFAGPIESMNYVLKEWRGLDEEGNRIDDALDGREDLLSGIYDICSALVGILETLKSALHELIPELSVDSLHRFSTGIKEFGAKMKSMFGLPEEIAEETEEIDKTAGALSKVGEEADIAGEKLEKALSSGSRGDEVKKLQSKLLELGYDLDGSVADGIFGPKTEKALKAFQKKNHLATTGIFDQKTFDALYGPGAIANIEKATEAVEGFNGSIEKGAKGEDVKKIQQALEDAGIKLEKYGVDGIFGKETEEAIKAFQKEHGLEITGKIDEKTYNLLFPKVTPKSVIETAIESAEEKIENLPPALQRLKDIAGGAFAVISIGARIFGFLTKSLRIVARTLAPIGRAFVSFAAAVGRFFVALNNAFKNAGFIQEWLDTFENLLSPVKSWLEGILNPVIEYLDNLEFEEIANNIVEWIGKIPENIKTAFNNFKNLGFVKGISNFFSGIIDSLKNLELVKNIIERIKSLPESIKTFFTDLWTKITGTDEEPGWIAKAGEWITSIWTSFTQLETVQNVLSTIKDLPEKIKTFFTDLWTKITGTDEEPGWIAKAGEWIASIWTSFTQLETVQNIWTTIKGLPEKIKTFFTDLWTAVTNGEAESDENSIAYKVGNWIKEFWETLDLGQKISGLLEWLKGLANKIIDAVTLFWNAITGKDAAVSDSDSADSSNVSIFAKVGTWIREFWETLDIGTKIESALEWLKELGRKIVDAVTSFWNSITGKDTDVSESGENGVSIFERLGNWLRDIWEKYDFKSKIDFVIEKIQLVWEKIINWFSGLKKDLSSFNAGDIGSKARFVFDRIKQGFIAVFSGFLDWVSPEVLTLIAIGGSVLVAIIGVVKIISGITNALDAFARAFGRNSYKAEKAKNAQSISETIHQIAEAIAIIAAAIFVLGTMNPDDLHRGEKTIWIIAGVLAAIALVSGIVLKGDRAEAVEKAGESIRNIGIAVGIMALSLWLLSKMDWPAIGKGLAAIGGILVLLLGFIVGVNKLGGGKFDIKGIVSIAIGVGILAASLWFLSKMKWAAIGKGLVAIGGILVLLFGFIALVNKFAGGKLDIKGVVGVAVAVGILAASLWFLSKMDWPAIGKGLVALLGIFVLLGGLVIVAGKFSRGATNLKGFIGVAIAIGILVGALWAITILMKDPETLFASIAVLGILMLMLSATVFAISQVKISLNSLLGIGAALLALAGTAAILMIFVRKMKGTNVKTILTIAGSIMGLLISIGGYFALMSLVPLPAIGTGLLAIVGIAAAILAIVAALGAIASNPQVRAFMTGGIDMLAEWIGNFMGKMQAAQLTSFSEGIQGLNQAGGTDVDDKAINNMLSIGKKFSKLESGLPKKSVGDRLLDFIIGSPLVNLGKDMKAFASGFNSFTTECSKIVISDDIGDKTAFMVSVATEFVDLEKNLPETSTAEKILQWLGANTPLKQLSEDMKDFASNFAMFALIVNAVDYETDEDTDLTDKVDFMISIGKQFAALEAGLPEQTPADKILQWLGASTPLTKLSEDMKNYATNFALFATILGSVTVDTSEDSDLDNKTDFMIKIGKKFAALEEGLPEQTVADKILQWLGASTPLEKLSEDMAIFAKKFSVFATIMNAVDVETDGEGSLDKKAEFAIKIAGYFRDLEASLPEKSAGDKVLEWLGADSPLASLSEGMADFAKGFGKFAVILGGVNNGGGTSNDAELEGKAEYITRIAGYFTTLQAQLPPSSFGDKVKAWLGLGSPLASFGNGMVDFAASFGVFANTLMNVDLGSGGAQDSELEAKSTFITKVAGYFVDLEAKLPEKTPIENILEWLGKESPLSKLSDDMTDFAANFSVFAGVLANTDLTNDKGDLDQKAQFITKVAGYFVDLEAKLPAKTPIENILEWLGKDSPLTQLSNDMTDFAANFSVFAGVLANTDLTNDQDDLDQKAQFITKVAGYFADLEAKLPPKSPVESIMAWLGADSPLEELAQGMTDFSLAFSVFAGILALTDLSDDSGDLDQKAQFITKIAGYFVDLEANLPEETAVDKVKAWLGGSSPLKTLSTDMVDFASNMNAFVTQMTGVTVDEELDTKVTGAIDTAKQIQSFLEGLKGVDIETNKGELEKFFSGDTKAETIFSTIGSIATSMSELNANFSFDMSTLKGKFDDAVLVLQSVSQFLTYLNSYETDLGMYTDSVPFARLKSYMDQIVAWFTDWSNKLWEDVYDDTAGYDVLISMIQYVASIMRMITDLSSKDFSTDTLTANFEQLKQILSGEGDYALTTENFTANLDAESVVNAINTFAESLSTSLSSGATSISNQADSFNQAGQALGSAVGSSAVSAVNDQSDALSGAGSSMLSAISSGMKGNLDTTNLKNAITRAASSLSSDSYLKFKTVGYFVDSGLAQGITDNKSKPINAAISVMKEAVAAAKRAGKVESPSKVFMEIGGYLDEGLKIGIDKSASMVVTSMGDLTNDTIDIARDSLAAVSDILSGDMNYDPVIRPVVDLSEVEAGSYAADSLLSASRTISVGMNTSNNVASASAGFNSRQDSNSSDKKSDGGKVINSGSSVNFNNNSFNIRDEQDIYSLAQELASLVASQQRGLGS